MTTTISSQHQADQYLERFSLIWFDYNPQDTPDIEQELKSIINHFKTFQDLQECQEYIQQTTSTDRLVLIVNSQFERQLISSIHQLQQVISIYIYPTDIEATEQHFSTYSKVIFFLVEKQTNSFSYFK